MRKLVLISVFSLCIYGLSLAPKQDVRAVSMTIGDKISASEYDLYRLLEHSRVQAYLRTWTSQLLTAKSSKTVSITAGDAGLSPQIQTAVNSMIVGRCIPQIQRTLHFNFLGPVEVRLFTRPQDYQQAIESLGANSSNSALMAEKTGGIAYGSRILVPLYNDRSPGSLISVLTHELTHVVFYQNSVVPAIPTWINEGTAWYEGITAGKAAAYDQFSTMLEGADMSILQAFSHHQGVYLTAGETALLKAPYDVEIEDYLAVSSLVKRGGMARYVSFLHRVPENGVQGAFRQEYGYSVNQFVAQFDRKLAHGML